MRFPDTPWTLIRSLGEAESQAGRAALEHVLARYLPVLRGYLIGHRRMTPPDADDLLQGFVTEKILEQHLLAQADARRGRFRALLLSALENYRVSRRRFDAAARRRPPGGSVPVEAAEDLAAADDPAAALGLRWARAVIDRATAAMRAECEAQGRDALWAVFAERVLREAAGQDPTPYDALCRRFALRSTTEAQNLLVTAKRMLRRHVEAIVAEYAADAHDRAAEIRDLLALSGQLDG